MTNRIHPILCSPKTFYTIATLAMLATYVRLFFGIDVTDEPYHVACALLTTLGAKFFINDSQIGQSASLIYEPIMAIYHRFFGNLGVILFVRHLYFLLSLVSFYSIFRLLKKMIAPEIAFLVSVLSVIFILYPSPTLGYNAIGANLFAIGAALTLNSAITSRISLSLLGGWAFSISVFSYPAFSLAVLLLYSGAILFLGPKKQELLFTLAPGAILCATLYGVFGGLTIYRFGLDPIMTAAKTTQLYGSGIVTAEFLKLKLMMFHEALLSLAPPLWSLSILVLSLALLKWKKLSWTWSILLISILFLIYVPEPLSQKLSPLLYITPLYLNLIFIVGLISLFRPLDGQKLFSNACLLVVAIGAVMGVVCFFNSSTQIVAATLGTRLGLIFLLARTAMTASRLSILVPMTAICIVVNYYNYVFSYREEPISNMNTLMTSGPFAGIVVSEDKANFLNQLESDLLKASSGAESIVSYDNFPAGFLFTNLRPATRSIFVHPMPYGHWDRDQYEKYYSDPNRRPDIVLQMEIFPYASDSFSINRNEWTRLPYDTFFDYLPNSGDYEEVQVRYIQSHVAYRIWRKKNLAKIE